MSLIFEIAKGDPRYGDHENSDAIERGVWYIIHGQKGMTEEEKLRGCEGIPDGTSPDAVIEWMLKTKQVFGLEEGVQCKHLIVSFGEKPMWKRKKLRKVMKKIVGFWKERYQLFWGVHYKVTEKGPNFHIHILLNTVNLKTGNRLNLNNKLWWEFKENTTEIWTNAIQEEKTKKYAGKSKKAAGWKRSGAAKFDLFE